MSHRAIVKTALLMILVFGATVLLYPMLFNPDNKSTAPIEAPPVAPIILAH